MRRNTCKSIYAAPELDFSIDRRRKSVKDVPGQCKREQLYLYSVNEILALFCRPRGLVLLVETGQHKLD